MKKQSKTCIACIKSRNGKLIMAGDRRASWDWDFAQTMPRAKISKRSGLLLGATGDSSLCTLLVDILEIPLYDNDDLDTYMFFKFRKAVNKLLLEQGYRDEHQLLNIPSDSSVTLLVGIRHKLYTVDVLNPDPEIMEHARGIIMIDEVNIPFAVGCGGSTALPILIAERKREGFSTKEHLKLAMEIAAEISPGCDNNLDFRSED